MLKIPHRNTHTHISINMSISIAIRLSHRLEDTPQAQTPLQSFMSIDLQVYITITGQIFSQIGDGRLQHI